MRALGSEDIRIVGTMLDPYRTDEPVHLDYHERTRQAGRLPGNVGLRVRYENLATEWFSLLWLSPTELAGLSGEHGWSMTDTEDAGILYAAEIPLA